MNTWRFIWRGNLLVALVVSAGLVCGAAGPAAAEGPVPVLGDVGLLETVILTAVADTQVAIIPNTTQNFGHDPHMAVAWQPAAYLLRCLVRFDLSSLPANAVVDSALLQLYLTSVEGSVPNLPISAHQVTSPWNETSVSTASYPSYGPVAALINVDSTAGTYKNWVITSLAQGWKVDPMHNYGVALHHAWTGDPYTGFVRVFATREAGGNPPRLVITYHLPPAPKKILLPLALKEQGDGAPGTLIFADDFNDGDLAGWTPHGGTWTNPSTFLQGSYQVYLGTAQNIRPELGTDFVYEGKVTLVSGNAAGLVFRSSADGESSYCLVLDATANCLKPCINWPGWFFSPYSVTVEYGRAYTLRAELVGDLLRVYLDGVHAFTATLGGYYSSGQFGVLVHNGVARFDDLAAWRLP